MTFEGWGRDEKGDFSMRAYAGHEFMIYGGIGIGLRLEFLQPGDQTTKPTGSVQLAMTNEGAKLLARDLIRAISQTERIRGEPKN